MFGYATNPNKYRNYHERAPVYSDTQLVPSRRNPFHKPDFSRPVDRKRLVVRVLGESYQTPLGFNARIQSMKQQFDTESEPWVYMEYVVENGANPET